MKTRYKIITIAICAYFGVFFGPVIVSNIYCDFIVQEMCTSRITGVNPPLFNMIPLSLPSDNECWYDDGEGNMLPCLIDTGYFEWPFPPRIHEYEHDSKCDEICLDDDFPENQKTKFKDERKNFCELHEGQWSDEFNNCVGGSIEVSCDDIDVSKFTPPDVFLVITEKGICMSHELFCKSMGGNSTCMSYEQMGHGREICTSVCEFR